MLTLIPPIKEYEKEIFDFKDEMLSFGDIEFNGCGRLEQYSSFEEWKDHLDSYADRNKMDPSCGLVEGRQYMLFDTEKKRVLGMANVRHYLNDFLMNLGGHIGYSIRPTERGKGYGTLQLKLALEKLKEIGVNDVLVTCDDDNTASYKTIESCGGTLENKVYSDKYGCFIRRYWINQ
ncbi:MAG: GNAT family N-acetyltransferase [Clostridia bacterium]|nr:GNAT family N-acetyltransferase [Clostridia bacterium]